MMKNNIIPIVVVILCILFGFSLFKNIAYPILWNDEAETAMFATRILEYGYPKVHDGKNVIYLLGLPGKIGIDEKSDAYIGSAWGHFYFAVPGALLAQKAGDIYVKTAILRMPFAIIGFIGLAILALSIGRAFGRDPASKWLFYLSFIFFELLSVSLILHLREVRYYSLVIFLSAAIFHVYMSYVFFKQIRPVFYVLSTILLLTLLANTFVPAYFIFAVTIGLHSVVRLFGGKSTRDFIIMVLPLAISLIAVMPIMLFFRTFIISAECAKFVSSAYRIYIGNITTILRFFQQYEFLSLVVLVKIVLIALSNYLKFNRPENFAVIRANNARKIEISNFFSLFCIVYILIIAKIPWYLFGRYYIALQPVVIMILLLDIFTIFDLISASSISIIEKRQLRTVIFTMAGIVFLMNGVNKAESVKNHVYELFHQYKGVLDYSIPYIKSKYSKPEDLIIATNYEECDYVYYLGSKVIVGFVCNNLEEDIKLQPDVVIFRKRSDCAYSMPIFVSYLQKAYYEKVSFPIFDYLVNNIPDLSGPIRHLYETKMAEDINSGLNIFIKQ